MKTPNADKSETFLQFIRKRLPKEKGKIAICNTFLMRGGGRTRTIEQQAITLSKEGYDVTLYALIGHPLPEQKFKQKIFSATQNPYLQGIFRIFFPFTPLSLRLLARLRSCDVVISNEGYPFGWLGYMAKRLFNTTYVYWYHDPVEDPTSSFSGPRKYYHKLIWFLDRKGPFIRSADYVATVGEVLKKDLERASGLQNIVAVPTELDHRSRFSNLVDMSHIQKKFGIAKSDPIILFVGNVTPRKGVDTLLEVFNLVKQSVPEAKLVIVGGTSFREYFQRLKNQANKGVIFTGVIEDDRELGAIYQAANVYVTCSLSEGFNLPLKEAHYFGLPIVTFDIPEHREAGKGGVHYLIERGNIKEFAETVSRILLSQ